MCPLVELADLDEAEILGHHPRLEGAQLPILGDAFGVLERRDAAPFGIFPPHDVSHAAEAALAHGRSLQDAPGLSGTELDRGRCSPPGIDELEAAGHRTAHALEAQA